MSFKVIPIPDRISNEVRETMLSPQYLHPASVKIAAGYGPCRSCLRTFNADKEERILFTYDSFEDLSDLPLPGPIFIHKDRCETFQGYHFPPDLIDLPLLSKALAKTANLSNERELITSVWKIKSKKFWDRVK